MEMASSRQRLLLRCAEIRVFVMEGKVCLGGILHFLRGKRCVDMVLYFA